MNSQRNVTRTRRLAIIGAERRERLRKELRCARVRNRFGRDQALRARLGRRLRSRLDVDFGGCVIGGRLTEPASRLQIGQLRSERSSDSLFDFGTTCLRVDLGFEVVRSVVVRLIVT